MSKLTDTQLIILSTAVKRDTRAVLPLPKSLKLNQGTVASVLKSLLRNGCLEETAAKRGEPHWREEDGEALALRITSAGLAALGIDAAAAAPAKRTDSRLLKAKVSQQRPPKGKKTKVDQVLDLMSRSSGASIEELQGSTGWQPHSVRAAITGLRKSGKEITLVRHEGKPSTYHAIAQAA